MTQATMTENDDFTRPGGLTGMRVTMLGCGASVLALARCRTPPPRATISPPEVVSRGPLTYAGPGSLGGTESALRR